MLLRGFTITSVLPTPRDPGRIRITAGLSDDVGVILPYLNAVFPRTNYDPENMSLTFKKGDRVVTLYSRTCAIGWLSDEEDALQTMNWIKDFVNETYENKDKIIPCYDSTGGLNALKVNSMLPRTNCKQCGEMTCLAFAIGLVDGEQRLEKCAPLSEPEFAERKRSLEGLFARARGVAT